MVLKLLALGLIITIVRHYILAMNFDDTWLYFLMMLCEGTSRIITGEGKIKALDIIGCVYPSFFCLIRLVKFTLMLVMKLLMKGKETTKGVRSRRLSEGFRLEKRVQKGEKYTQGLRSTRYGLPEWLCVVRVAYVMPSSKHASSLDEAEDLSEEELEKMKETSDESGDFCNLISCVVMCLIVSWLALILAVDPIRVLMIDICLIVTVYTVYVSPPQRHLEIPELTMTAGKFPGPKGIYRVYSDCLGYLMYRGMAYVDEGVLYTRNHVAGTSSIYYMDMAISRSYVDVRKDLIAYGGVPKSTSCKSGEYTRSVLANLQPFNVPDVECYREGLVTDADKVKRHGYRVTVTMSANEPGTYYLNVEPIEGKYVLDDNVTKDLDVFKRKMCQGAVTSGYKTSRITLSIPQMIAWFSSKEKIPPILRFNQMLNGTNGPCRRPETVTETVKEWLQGTIPILFRIIHATWWDERERNLLLTLVRSTCTRAATDTTKWDEKDMNLLFTLVRPSTSVVTENDMLDIFLRRVKFLVRLLSSSTNEHVKEKPISIT